MPITQLSQCITRSLNNTYFSHTSFVALLFLFENNATKNIHNLAKHYFVNSFIQTNILKLFNGEVRKIVLNLVIFLSFKKFRLRRGFFLFKILLCFNTERQKLIQQTCLVLSSENTVLLF
jgi:hypothetical protein